MWGWIPQFGHTVFFWSTLVAAVFGGIGIGAAFISAMVGYELSEWASRDANERISNAERSAKVEIEKARSDADAKIGIAQADIAQSRKETEEAKARALEAQLALERYKQPRNLDIDSFLQRLKGVPSRKVQVLYVRECSDCSWVAQFIGSFLNTANWESTWAPIDEKAAATGPWRMQPSAVSVRGSPWGITVVAKDITPEALGGPKGASVMALFEALLASYAPSVTMAFDSEMPDDLIRVVVAPKP